VSSLGRSAVGAVPDRQCLSGALSTLLPADNGGCVGLGPPRRMVCRSRSASHAHEGQSVDGAKPGTGSGPIGTISVTPKSGTSGEV
jgi:hypothetical protein